MDLRKQHINFKLCTHPADVVKTTLGLWCSLLKCVMTKHCSNVIIIFKNCPLEGSLNTLISNPFPINAVLLLQWLKSGEKAHTEMYFSVAAWIGMRVVPWTLYISVKGIVKFYRYVYNAAAAFVWTEHRLLPWHIWNHMVVENSAAVHSQQLEWTHWAGCREKEVQGGFERAQWKRLVNIICFIDLTVKTCHLSFMLLWLAPLEIQPQIKSDILKNLSIFMYLFFISTPCLLGFCVEFCDGFAHFIIFMSNYYDSTTYDSSVPPRGISGTGEGSSRPTEDSVNHEVSFKVWKVMPVRKLLKINSPEWLTPGCKKKYYETMTFPNKFVVHLVSSLLYNMTLFW